MTSRDFVYWLQGFAELAPDQAGLTKDQWDTIRRHLAMVFRHEIDPSMGSKEHQVELTKIHDVIKTPPPPLALWPGESPRFNC